MKMDQRRVWQGALLAQLTLALTIGGPVIIHAAAHNNQTVVKHTAVNNNDQFVKTTSVIYEFHSQDGKVNQQEEVVIKWQKSKDGKSLKATCGDMLPFEEFKPINGYKPNVGVSPILKLDPDVPKTVYHIEYEDPDNWVHGAEDGRLYLKDEHGKTLQIHHFYYGTFTKHCNAHLKLDPDLQAVKTADPSSLDFEFKRDKTTWLLPRTILVKQKVAATTPAKEKLSTKPSTSESTSKVDKDGGTSQSQSPTTTDDKSDHSTSKTEQEKDKPTVDKGQATTGKTGDPSTIHHDQPKTDADKQSPTVADKKEGTTSKHTDTTSGKQDLEKAKQTEQQTGTSEVDDQKPAGEVTKTDNETKKDEKGQTEKTDQPDDDDHSTSGKAQVADDKGQHAMEHVDQSAQKGQVKPADKTNVTEKDHDQQPKKTESGQATEPSTTSKKTENKETEQPVKHPQTDTSTDQKEETECPTVPSKEDEGQTEDKTGDKDNSTPSTSTSEKPHEEHLNHDAQHDDQKPVDQTQPNKQTEQTSSQEDDEHSTSDQPVNDHHSSESTVEHKLDNPVTDKPTVDIDPSKDGEHQPEKGSVEQDQTPSKCHEDDSSKSDEQQQPQETEKEGQSEQHTDDKQSTDKQPGKTTVETVQGDHQTEHQQTTKPTTESTKAEQITGDVDHEVVKKDDQQSDGTLAEHVQSVVTEHVDNSGHEQVTHNEQEKPQPSKATQNPMTDHSLESEEPIKIETVPEKVPETSTDEKGDQDHEQKDGDSLSKDDVAVPKHQQSKDTSVKRNDKEDHNDQQEDTGSHPGQQTIDSRVDENVNEGDWYEKMNESKDHEASRHKVDQTATSFNEGSSEGKYSQTNNGNWHSNRIANERLDREITGLSQPVHTNRKAHNKHLPQTGVHKSWLLSFAGFMLGLLSVELTKKEKLHK